MSEFMNGLEVLFEVVQTIILIGILFSLNRFRKERWGR